MGMVMPTWDIWCRGEYDVQIGGMRVPMLTHEGMFGEQGDLYPRVRGEFHRRWEGSMGGFVSSWDIPIKEQFTDAGDEMSTMSQGYGMSQGSGDGSIYFYIQRWTI